VNKLNKIQRQQLSAIAVGTIALLVALWFLFVTGEEKALSETKRKCVQTQDKLRNAEGYIRIGDDIANKLQARQQLLETREETLAPDRDAYAWILNTINPFIQSRSGVNIYFYSQPETNNPDNKNAGMLPAFPYPWAKFRLNGVGYYHDFGKFFADMENNFPYFRVQNVSIGANTMASTDPEKLNFAFELVVPMKLSDTK
jgi:hypothetical protein